MKLPKILSSLFVIPLIAPLALFAVPKVIQSDVCVYGGTSGGVIAAVAAARLGKTASLVLVNNHVGGLTSGGLGVTDIGNANSIGGMAHEFYLRVGQAYGSTNAVYYFEPHVAEQAYLAMLNGAGVPIYTNQQLASVTMSNLSITQITMSDGTIYRAKEFIDTTYEGDLMALAGVTFTVGREGTSVYSETLAGIQTPGGGYTYDPYIVPGNAASGLLPFVQAGSAGTQGQGDNKVQVYNFRLCLTQNVTNQIPITAPANYSEATYELFRRYIAARVAQDGSVALNQLIDVQTIIPNGKTDINANGELSTDYVGYNYTYPTNTYAGRQVIYQQHQDYIRGMLYYFATSTNVPANVRTSMQSWALAKDEFQDNGGWPYPLYVREARRMVSDYVMTQQNALGSRAVTDSIALASYTLDSHPVQRLAVNGNSRWEGSIGTSVPFPYGVSYHSIIPSVGQCQNLFCTFALSASHVGFASVRLEPVFMMVSQSGATAASLAIDNNVPVQQVDYPTLAAKLTTNGQILAWVTESNSTNGIILDNDSTNGVTKSAGWTSGSNQGGWNDDYLHDGSNGKGTKWVQYNPTLPTSGTYNVYQWWVASSNRSTNTPVDITAANGTTRVLVNQVIAQGGWFKILTTNFNAGTNSLVTIRNDNTQAGTYVIADAVRWEFVPPPIMITNVTVIARPRSATISWTTSSNAVAQFNYGTTTAYGGTCPLGATLTNNPTILLTGLQTNTVYYFQIISGFGTYQGIATGSFSTDISVIVPSAHALYSGVWVNDSSATNRYSTPYKYASMTPPAAAAQATFRPTIATPGQYDVYLWYSEGANRSAFAPVTIGYSGGAATVLVNETVPGGNWHLVAASEPLDPGTNAYVRLANNSSGETNKIVIADAVRWVYSPAQDAPANGSLPVWWSEYYFSTDILNSSDLGANGYSLLANYTLGLSPVDPLAQLSFNLHPVKGGFQARFAPFQNGCSYQLQMATNLASPVWMGLTNLPLSVTNGQGTIAYTNAVSNGPSYFRLSVLLGP